MSEARGGRKIVLIEDDADIAALIEEVLADGGHEVDVRSRLADGPVDSDVRLVITDFVHLHGYDPEAARTWISTVRARFPRAAVLVSTAHEGTAVGGAEAIGADALVTKPFDLAAFSEAVESLLDR